MKKMSWALAGAASALAAAVMPAAATTTAQQIQCDGSDVTAALNTALAAGGTVELSAGTCVISSTLNVVSNTVLAGAGIGATILMPASLPGYAMITIGGSTLLTGAQNVDISNLSIDGGNQVGIAPATVDGIWSQWSSTAVNIHDLEVYAAGQNGIAVNGSYVTVQNNLVHDNQANGIYVLGKGHPGLNDAVPASNVQILSNTVTNNSLGYTPDMAHGWDGIDIDPITQDCLVENNNVSVNDIILYENAEVVPNSSGHQVIGNTITNVTQGGAGIDVAGPQDNFVVSGNTINTVVGQGIGVNGPVQTGLVQGNNVSGATGIGISGSQQRPDCPHRHTKRRLDPQQYDSGGSRRIRGRNFEPCQARPHHRQPYRRQPCATDQHGRSRTRLGRAQQPLTMRPRHRRPLGKC